MSRSMHSSTEYFGSPRLYWRNSRLYFPFTSVIGKRSRKTRSSETSCRSPWTSSGTRSELNAWIWMSSRLGIGMPTSRLENTICGRVSSIRHSHATQRAPSRAPPPNCGGATRGGSTTRLRGASNLHASHRSRGQRQIPRSRSGRAFGLLQLDDGSLLLQLLLHLFGFGLGHAFLHGARRAIDQVLRLLQTQAGQFPHHLDDPDLLGTGFLEDDGELRLLLYRRGRATRPTRSGRTSGRDDRDVELCLEGLDQIGELQHAHLADGFEDLFLAKRCGSHVDVLSRRLRSSAALLAKRLEAASE